MIKYKIEVLREQIALLETQIAELEKVRIDTCTPIKEVDFGHRSVRIQNCLKAGGYNLIEDLIDVSDQKLAECPNLGKCSLSQVKHTLVRLGVW